MALASVLRNSCKIHGARFFRQASFSPLKTYTTSILPQASCKPLSLIKIDVPQPVSRSISVSAPRLSEGHNHATIWNIDRMIIAAMIGILPAAFLFPSQAMDTLLATSLVIHQHWGMEAMIVDYVRPSVVGHALPKIAMGVLYLFSVAVLGGLFFLIYNDIGIAESVKKLWAVQGYVKEEEEEVVAEPVEEGKKKK